MNRSLAFICVTALLIGAGCSGIEAPDTGGTGVISLRFSGSTDAPGAPALSSPGDSFAQALAVADHATVKVFRPGNDFDLEVSQSEAIPDPPVTLDMSLTVVAENNKRVAVELYESGSLIYFGVNDDVDVSAGKNTHVSVLASQYEAGGIWHEPALVGEGDDFQMEWNRVAQAQWYRVQESPFPDFSAISWEGTTPDTFMAVKGGDLPKGDYYFRVAAVNPYSESDFGPAHYVRVFGAPEPQGVSDGTAERGPVEGMRGATGLYATVTGDNLDYPGTTVSVFGRPAEIVGSPQRTSMRIKFDIPAGAFSSRVTVTNPVGSSTSDGFVFVQNIAYIMGSSTQGDWASADDYKLLVDGFGDASGHSHVAIIPYNLLSLFANLDMFDLVIVGWDTGTDPANWAGGASAAVDLMDKTTAAVLGVGVGGCALFEAMGLDIGLYSTTAASQADVYVYDDADVIYNEPGQIAVPQSGYVDVYDVDASQLAVYVDVLNPPSGVTAHARRAPLSALFPLIEQQGKNSNSCFLWGFHESPAHLTAAGAQLTANVVVDLLGKNLQLP